VSNPHQERLRNLAWPPTAPSYVHALHHALRSLTDRCALLAADLPGCPKVLYGKPLWLDVEGVERVLDLSFDIPRDITRFPYILHAELWLRQIFSELPPRQSRLRAPAGPDDVRQLASRKYLSAFRKILSLIPDPFGGPGGKLLVLYEWSCYHFSIKFSEWNFDASVGPRFWSRWQLAELDDDGEDYRPPSEAREIRRRLLLEVGLLRTDSPDSSPAARTALERGSQAPPVDSGDEAPYRRLNPGSRALAAAYELRKEGTPVSLKAACERAGVDRKNVAKRFPDEAKIISRLSVPERTPRRGTRDRRTGHIDGIDSADD
jgi:hypothetical protein